MSKTYKREELCNIMITMIGGIFKSEDEKTVHLADHLDINEHLRPVVDAAITAWGSAVLVEQTTQELALLEKEAKDYLQKLTSLISPLSSSELEFVAELQAALKLALVKLQAASDADA